MAGTASRKRRRVSVEPESEDDQALDSDRSLSSSLGQFGLEVYRQIIASQPANSNVLFSPFSLTSALMLIYPGARGISAKELASALYLDHLAPAEILSSFRALMTALIEDTSDASFTLSLANKIYVDTAFPLAKDYVKQTTSINGSVGQLNFRQQAKAVREINQWVTKETNGKIENVVADGEIEKDTVMAIINAVYFKGVWAKVFAEHLTNEEDFYNLDGTVTETELMNSEELRMYFDNFREKRKKSSKDANLSLPQFQMVAVPYQGQRLSMVIILPKARDGLSKLERSLTAEKLAEAMEEMTREKVDLTMPKFRLEETYSLQRILKGHGMEKLFAGLADLTGVSAKNQHLEVTSGVHKTFIEVDEKGTVAVAVTRLLATKAARASPAVITKEVLADHPFMFGIYHQETKVFLFLGRVAHL